jgi:flagellar basal-body rod protein FlgF
VSTINRGIYSAASGMLAQQYVQDAIAANLANINTAGYKQDVATFREMSEMAIKRYSSAPAASASIGSVGLGVTFDTFATDMTAGSVADTGNPLDLALIGDGYFALQTEAGERYTRAGQFRMQPTGKSADGQPTVALTDDNGHALLGAKGPITIANPRNVSVAQDGSVMSGGVIVDHLKLVTAPAASMKKQGGNLFMTAAAITASKATVHGGAIEQSNVSPIQSMARMVTMQRAYDAAQKAIVAQDEQLGKAVSDLPKT